MFPLAESRSANHGRSAQKSAQSSDYGASDEDEDRMGVDAGMLGGGGGGSGHRRKRRVESDPEVPFLLGAVSVSRDPSLRRWGGGAGRAPRLRRRLREQIEIIDKKKKDMNE